MRPVALLPALLLAACAAAPAAEDAEISDGKGDRASGSRFDEVEPAHSTRTFRRYIEAALDHLDRHDAEIAGLTLWSIEAGYVKIDELRDLTCADFQRVRADLPDAGLAEDDHLHLRDRGSDAAAAIEGALDGYMWSDRIYVARGLPVRRLAATLVHEVNHVINRSEVGYYDDLPTSAFVHEYRAFHAERLIDPEAYAGVDLAAYVLSTYELDAAALDPAVRAQPLTPRLLPDAEAWAARRVQDDVEAVPAACE